MSRFFRKTERGNYDARAIANWFIRRSREDANQDEKTQLQLLKLVYFAHGWMLGIYGRPLLTQDVKAWKHGPVVPDLYHAIKDNGSDKITKEIDGFRNLTSIDYDEAATDILEQVHAEYGPMHGYELSDITHRVDSPWFNTRMQRWDGATIPNDEIQEFFSRPKVDA